MSYQVTKTFSINGVTYRHAITSEVFSGETSWENTITLATFQGRTRRKAGHLTREYLSDPRTLIHFE